MPQPIATLEDAQELAQLLANITHNTYEVVEIYEDQHIGDLHVRQAGTGNDEDLQPGRMAPYVHDTLLPERHTERLPA